VVHTELQQAIDESEALLGGVKSILDYLGVQAVEDVP